MKAIRRIALMTAFAAPCSFAFTAEASAFESFSIKSQSIKQQSIDTVPSMVTEDFQDDSSEYTEETSNSKKVAEFITISAGAIMLVGSVVLLANSLDSRHNNKSIESVRIISSQKIPIGPEDDPDFWPPKS